MKSFFKITLSALLIIGAFIGWMVLGPTIQAKKNLFIYIKSNSHFDDVKETLSKNKIIDHPFFFNLLATLTDYPNHIKPGRYEITPNSSLFSLVRKLRAGRQTEVRLVINKMRTKEDFAGKIGQQFEADSSEVIHFLLNNDSLVPFLLDTNTVMSTIIPNTYLCWWDGSFGKLFARLKKQHDYFWEGKRSIQAKKIGLTPIEVYTIASIVEEETLMTTDKAKIASVYLNRLKKGMKLEADPTVKYAMRNFELKRIMHGHLSYPSAYNTYQMKGLPPGPICTPSIETIDAVLWAPDTDYLFFVAKPNFSGYSNFASNYSDHLKNAAQYQQALNTLMPTTTK
jgi:UPF0755 protein